MSDMQEFVLGIRGTIKLYEKILGSRCAEYGLSLLELNIINFLYYNPEKNTGSDIVEYRMLPKANVSKGIDSLVRKGYLRREEDTSDRRCTNLFLLPAAESLTHEIELARSEYFSCIFEGFSEEQRCEYFELSEKIRKNVGHKL